MSFNSSILFPSSNADLCKKVPEYDNESCYGDENPHTFDNFPAQNLNFHAFLCISFHGTSVRNGRATLLPYMTLIFEEVISVLAL